MKIRGRIYSLMLLEMGADALRTPMKQKSEWIMECTRWWATHFSEDSKVHDVGHLKVHLVIRRRDLDISVACSMGERHIGLFVQGYLDPKVNSDMLHRLTPGFIENAKQTGSCPQFSWNERGEEKRRCCHTVSSEIRVYEVGAPPTTIAGRHTCLTDVCTHQFSGR